MIINDKVFMLLDIDNKQVVTVALVPRIMCLGLCAQAMPTHPGWTRLRTSGKDLDAASSQVGGGGPDSTKTDDGAG